MTKPNASRLSFNRRQVLGLLGAGAGATLLGACSPNQQAENSGSNSSGAAKVTVGFRLWDDQVAKAYQKSFDAFTKKNPDITVKINVVPWDSYWDQLPIDVGGDTVDDLFWTNSQNFTQYADAGKISDINTLLGGADDAWQKSLVEQYSYKDKLWAVPQVADANGIFYNKKLLDAAGVDPTKLTWKPGAGSGDTFLPAIQKLTQDSAGKTAAESGFNPKKLKVYGHNAAYDLQGIYFPFLGSNGGLWQADG
ncbi:MAG TPA: extracellular solute-binding protein, partial [Microlunatus sp.]